MGREIRTNFQQTQTDKLKLIAQNFYYSYKVYEISLLFFFIDSAAFMFYSNDYVKYFKGFYVFLVTSVLITVFFP